jgi:hypothetical protein
MTSRAFPSLFGLGLFALAACSNGTTTDASTDASARDVIVRDAQLDAGADAIDVAIPDARLDATDDAIDADAPDLATLDSGRDANEDDAVDAVPPPDADCGDATLCGAACVSLASDARNCGACGNDCTALPGVDSSAVRCVAGSCDVSSACVAGRAHCTANPNDGCETDLTTVANCGACDRACTSAANGTVSCDTGTCSIACDPGYHLCGAVCASDTDPAMCGGSCTACLAPANATATCVASSCGFACNAGYVLDGATCDPVAPPRPIAPLSTATVTSRRPLLHWSLAPATDGTHVDLCRDRACSAVIESFDASGTSGAPTADLPSGVVFWRLRSRSSSVTATATSAVWEFTVGPRSAPVDSSWGTRLDLDGDGFADLAVGAISENSNAGRVYVYSGGPTGPSTMPVALDGTDGANAVFGTSVASAGDIDGDGFADLVVGAPHAASSTGRVYLYRGGPSGVATTAATILTGPDGANGMFGSSVASAGDVNGDGYADVVIGAMHAVADAGRAYVYLGSAAGLVSTPATTLVPDESPAEFGTSVATAGDVNGDGYADVLVGAQTWRMSTGEMYAYLGSAAGLNTRRLRTVAGRIANSFGGASVSCAGDVNGDGYADVVMGAPHDGPGSVVVTFGDGVFPLASSRSDVRLSIAGIAGFGTSVSAGDFDDDGYADLLVAAPGTGTITGSVYVFAGSSAGPATSPTVTIGSVPPASTNFGRSVSLAGDTNGDAIDDAIVGDYTSPGRAFFYRGRAIGISTAPDATLLSPTGPGGLFGFAVY